VIKCDVGDDGRHCGKGKPIGEGKLGRQIEWRVRMVFSLVEMHVLVQDGGDVVDVARIVERMGRLDRQEISVPGAGVMDSDGDKNEKDGDASESVGNSVEGWDERRSEIARDNAPVLQRLADEPRTQNRLKTY
jgi:hypothetical protein